MAEKYKKNLKLNSKEDMACLYNIKSFRSISYCVVLGLLSTRLQSTFKNVEIVRWILFCLACTYLQIFHNVIFLSSGAKWGNSQVTLPHCCCSASPQPDRAGRSLCARKGKEQLDFTSHISHRRLSLYTFTAFLTIAQTAKYLGIETV